MTRDQHHFKMIRLKIKPIPFLHGDKPALGFPLLRQPGHLGRMHQNFLKLAARRRMIRIAVR